MNYFRCTVGGSGKGNTVTVTCAEEFAGLTITLSKTGKTYTKTCPSTTPYVVTFYGVENGTYTVSCTVDGQTYSETVVVQDISCVLNYGFTWRTWVDTASQLDSSDYDSLDEVLADEKALRELFLEHACVDYMAELASSNEDLETVINNDLCAKWINLSDYALDFLHANEVIADLMDEADKYGYGEWALMPQVPTMTSNTAPYGVASASSEYSNGYAWGAFDGDDVDTAWVASNYTAKNVQKEAWIQYKFTTPICIKEIRYVVADIIYTDTMTVLGSNDGTDFVTIDTFNNVTNGTSVLNMDNDDEYLYYRLNLIQHHTRTDPLYMPAVRGIQFYAWAPKGNVPVMTSNTAPYGNVLYANYASSYDPYKAFDNNDTTAFVGGTSVYLGYEFVNPICLKRVKYRNHDGYYLLTGKVLAKNGSDADWTVLKEIVGTSVALDEITIDISDNTNYYTQYKVQADTWSGTSSNYLAFRTLQFYGRELKVSVPTMTSNTAPFGEAFADSESSASYAAWKAFDGDDNTYAAGTSKLEHYWGYVFPSDVKVKMAMIYSSSIPVDHMYIESADSKNGEFSGEEFTITASGSYKYFITLSEVQANKAIRFRAKKSTNFNGAINMQFYGLDYSEKEFEVGTTKKWLYDHGVELEELYLTTGSTFGTVVRESNRIKATRTTTTTGADGGGLYIATNNKINFTLHSLLRVNIDSELYDSRTDLYPSFLMINDELNDSSSIASVRVYNSKDKPHVYLPCSSVNGEYYPIIGPDAYATSYITINEFWLE